MAMTENMLGCIRFLASNDTLKAKQYALACCCEDTSKKNQHYVNRYKKMLEGTADNIVEVPMNLKRFLTVTDPSKYNDRYFLSNTESNILENIQLGTKVTEKMLEMRIPYANSTLLYGAPGVGKTELAKYIAYKLNLPFAYVNFSYVIDSLMGKTSQNLQEIFNFCSGFKCVLMIDEIDCIGLARSNGDGPSGELGRTTICLMQMLDTLTSGQILIAATNRQDRLDSALRRRFQRSYEMKKFERDDRLHMIELFLSKTGMEYDQADIEKYAAEDHTQSEITTHIIDSIAIAIGNDTNKVVVNNSVIKESRPPA